MLVNVCDDTLQCTFCLDVRKSEPLSSVHLRRHENQCAVSADGPRVSFFFKRRSDVVLPGDAHWDSHQYALTSSAVCREPGSLAGFGKPRCKSATLLRLNSGKHQAHALADSGVDDSSVGLKQLCSFVMRTFVTVPKGSGLFVST